MKRKLIILGAALILASSVLSAELKGTTSGIITSESQKKPEEILKESDNRFVPETFSYSMTIETENDDGKISKQMSTGYKKGNNRNVMIVKEPKRTAGTVNMRKENSIWVYFPSNSKTMKTAYQSLALGQAISYGDILASELSYDYDIEKFEEVNNDYSFTLKPKQNHEGYAKVTVIIDKSNLLPKRREYFALSGVLLKTCEFKKIDFNEKGEVTLVKQEFFDPIKEKKNYVTIENIKISKDIPEKYYNENQLKFLNN